MNTTAVKTKKKISEQTYQEARTAYVNAENEACILVAKRDKEVTKIDEKYNPQLDTLMKEQDDSFAIMQQYCEENKAAMFPLGTKSIKDNALEVGFKLGKHKVELMEASDDKETNKEQWEAATALVEKKLPDYVRTITEINKARLLEDRDLAEVVKLLPKCGLKIDQDNTFFVKIIKSKKK